MTSKRYVSMNSAISRLPRFNPAHARTPLANFNTGAQRVEPASAPAAVAEQSADEDHALPAASEPVAHPMDAELAEAMEQLSRGVNRAEIVVQQQIGEAVSGIAATLFPALAQKFLADEIMAQLPKIVTMKTRTITLKAAPSIAARLSTLVEKTPSLVGRCRVMADSTIENGKLDIIWGEGGVSYDLNASLADLINLPASTNL